MPRFWIIGTIGVAATAVASSFAGHGPAARFVGFIARELGRAVL